MARLPRITVRGIAHPVTQRGNHRQQIFIEEDDYGLYRDLLGITVTRYHLHYLVLSA